jgi:uncharacterized protein (TIGR02301 family)
MLRLLALTAFLALGAAPAAAQSGWFQQFFGVNPRPQYYGPPRDLPRAARPLPPRVAPKPQAVNVPQSPSALEGATPPYEGELSRLAEILGALHYLRPLCGAQETGRWRGEMQGLIEAEQPAGERRNRMIASFNRGFSTYEQTYRACTAAAGLAIHRYLDEGARLSREIATRYGN